VSKRRSYDARFFKPVCLIAVLDGLDAGTLDARDIDPTTAVDLFRRRVGPLFPKRAGLGWRPFWHLSNDGAWYFFRQGERIWPEDFGKPRKPNSMGGLFRRIDRVSVPPETEVDWALAERRNRLRRDVLQLLLNDPDPDCQLIGAHLAEEGVAPGPAELLAAPGQGFLASAPLRRAVERRAMALAIRHFEEAGWLVEDVSATSSFDLLCTKGRDRRYVEVKGTTGAGEQIILTQRELEFARRNRSDMSLAVISGIELKNGKTDQAAASGGYLRVIDGWAPEPAQVTPISYMCVVGRELD
jgi:hypothetical protein